MSEYLTDLRSVWKKTAELQEVAESGDVAAIRQASQSLRALSDELDIDFVYSDFGKALRESQEGSERIRHIVQDLRDFSHRDTGELLLSDINQSLDSTASIVWTMMKHTIVLNKEYSDLPQVRCRPMQIKQVFMNLLVNAYQAIEEKIAESGAGGEEGKVGRVDIRTWRNGGGVCISIRDSGVGISGDDMLRIFDPFFTTKKVGSGTGLGLSMSYNIIQRHGGTIKAVSEPGEGSLFEVWLPEGHEAGREAVG
jgi:signal transduction histidine kinase